MSTYDKYDKIMHGGDYNPDQWLKYPDILKSDIKFMQEANVNTVTVGIFSWSQLEPEEGMYTFDWLDKIFEDVHSINGNIILSTPSGARPAWMAKKYPEVLRTNANREKLKFGGRHNHCLSSPIYREKVGRINEKLANRYGNHPALLMWHISNEYGGECHCDRCQTDFRSWLKAKYKKIESVNEAWWGPFWSHSYSEWDEIESPSVLGESMVHGLNLDWKRFVTDQTIDFYENEIKFIRKITPDIPITTNFMADTSSLIPFQSLDYERFAKHVDIVSWDCYPPWHNDSESTAQLASKVGFINDLYRSLKQKPFLIMESTPSGVNWHDFNKSKRPGMHLLSSTQFIAHGSDSIMYFQWRQSRGSSEKFHGAVVGHDNSMENRVFQDVKQVGEVLGKISEIKGSNKKSKVAILYDWENNWALDDSQGFSDVTKKYCETLQNHYEYFWKNDISMDVITPSSDFDKYDLLIAPMLYMIKENTLHKLEQFVQKGGNLVSTYITGLVNENDLVFLNGWPKQLQNLFGIKILEIDTYYPSDRNQIEMNQNNFKVKDYAPIIEVNHADILATYQKAFYVGKEAITSNIYGKGKAYFIGCRTENDFLDYFYSGIVKELHLQNSLVVEGDPEVSVQSRENADNEYLFIMNFSEKIKTIKVSSQLLDMVTKETIQETIELSPYAVKIAKKC